MLDHPDSSLRWNETGGVAVTVSTQAGDRIDAMVSRYRLPLLGFIGRSGGGADAEDLFQETMLRAWRHLPRVPLDPEGERRWLYVVARRIVLDAIRRRRVRPVTVSLNETAWAAGDDQTSDTVVARLSFRQAYESLDPGRRQVLNEIYVEGRSLADTAEKLQIPLGTVKSRAHYAMRHVRNGIEGRSPAQPAA
jgi:RNA polymerase sigma-70 factor (ECF subfamily)